MNAQNTLSIDNVVEIVFKNSNQIQILKNNNLKKNIESDFHRISLLPKISSSISFPYQRSISEVIQSNGSQQFIERNFLNSTLNLNISQVLPFTGGTLGITSSINSARDFNNKTSNFSSNWFSISYQQSINGFNSFKWDKKRDPLETEKKSLDFIKEKLKLKYDVSKVYLETQLIQLKLRLLDSNIKKTEEILYQLEEKFKYGRVIKIEVQEAKLTLQQFKDQLNNSNLEYLYGIESLKHLMKYDAKNNFSLIAVEKNDFLIDKDELITAIKKNGIDLDKAIKLLEVNSNIEKVKKDGSIIINLQVGTGLNSSANNLANLYELPSQSQYITLSTKIPILDWGKSKKNYSIAKIEKENLELTTNISENKITEQINDLINYKISIDSKLKSLKEQLNLSQEINEMFEELLNRNRKTIAEYKTQLAESFTINLEYQKSINDLYLLKLKINEFYLTL